MQILYSTLGIYVDDEELKRVVAAHSWENIPQKDKGKGKFTRKATPGGWREDLTSEQARVVKEINEPCLKLSILPKEICQWTGTLKNR